MRGKISGIVAEMSGQGNQQKMVNPAFGGSRNSPFNSKDGQSVAFVVSASADCVV